jgi:hypothetical protein
METSLHIEGRNLTLTNAEALRLFRDMQAQLERRIENRA